MIGLNTSEGFTARDVLNEMKDIMKEAKTNPAQKDRKRLVKERADAIIETLSKNGYQGDGLTMLALAKLGIEAAQIIEDHVRTTQLIEGLLDAAQGEESSG